MELAILLIFLVPVPFLIMFLKEKRKYNDLLSLNQEKTSFYNWRESRYLEIIRSQKRLIEYLRILLKNAGVEDDGSFIKIPDYKEVDGYTENTRTAQIHETPVIRKAGVVQQKEAFQPIPGNQPANQSAVQSSTTACAVPANQTANQPTVQSATTAFVEPAFKPIPVNQPATRTDAGEQNVGFKESKAQQIKEKKEKSNTGIVLVVGVVLLLLSSIGFMSATWSILADGVRALLLLSLSVIFIVAGVLAKFKFKLPSTALAFYSIGSIALPITIVGASALELFGDTLVLKGTPGHFVFAIAFFSLLVLMAAGAGIFKSRVFAIGSLICNTAVIISLATIGDWKYDLNMLLIAVASSVLIFAAPWLSRKAKGTIWNSYSDTVEISSIINQYVLSTVALGLGKTGVMGGIYIILISALFLFGVFRKQKNCLLSLPHILFICIGVFKILNVIKLMGITAALGFCICGAYLFVISFVKKIPSLLSKIFALTGISFTTVSVFTVLLHQQLNPESWMFIPVIVTALAIFIFYSLYKKKPILSLLAVISVQVMTICIANKIYPNENMIMASTTLIALVFTVLYLIYVLIPKNPLYSVVSEMELFIASAIGICVYLCANHESVAGNIAAVVASIMLTAFALYNAVADNRICDKIVAKCGGSVDDSEETDAYIPSAGIRARKTFYSIIWTYVPTIILFSYCSDLLFFRGIAFAAAILGILAYLMLSFKGSIGKDCSADRKIRFYSALSKLFIYSLFVLPIVNADGAAKSFSIVTFIVTLFPLIFTVTEFVYLIRNKLTSSEGTAFIANSMFAALGAAVISFCRFMKDYCGVTSPYLTAGFIIFVLGLIGAAALIVIINRAAVEERGKYITRHFKSVFQAVFIWSFLFRISGVLTAFDSHYSPYVSATLFILYSLAVVLLYRHQFKIVSVFGFVGLYLSYVYGLLTNYKCLNLNNGSVEVCFLAMIPLLVFAVLTAINRSSRICKDAFLYGTLAYALMNMIDSHDNAIFSLLGFIMIITAYYLRSDNKDSKIRAICLAVFTLSTALWFPIPFEYDHISKPQVYLIPTTIFAVLLPWIFVKLKEKKRVCHNIQLIYGCLVMTVFGIMTIIINEVPDMMVFAILSVLILVIAYLVHDRGFTILGAASTLAFLLYSIGKIFGEKSWFVYLALSGLTLIGFAVRSEIKRRNSKKQ